MSKMLDFSAFSNVNKLTTDTWLLGRQQNPKLSLSLGIIAISRQL